MYCPRCTTVNQDDSKFCLKCGQSLAAGATVVPLKRKQSLWYLAIVIPCALLMMIGVIGALSQPSDNTVSDEAVPAMAQTSSAEDAPAQSVAPKAEPSQAYDMEVTADKLIADYDANEIRADEKYKGKYVKVTGVVNSIGKDILDNAYITIGESDKTFFGIQAYFKDSTEISKAAKLAEGDKVTLIGRVTGGSFNVGMKDCVIVDE